MKKRPFALIIALALTFAACTSPEVDDPLPVPDNAEPSATARVTQIIGDPHIPDDLPPAPGVVNLLTVVATIMEDYVWYNEGFGTATDKMGNTYSVGYRYDPVPNADYVAVVTKYNSDGVWQWAVQVNPLECWGCSAVEKWNDVAVSDDGSSVYVVGETPIALNGEMDWIVAKYSKDGEQLWMHTFPNPGNDQATGVVYDDATDALFVVGAWSSFNSNGRILRLTGASGSFVWSDTTSMPIVSDVSLDPTIGGADGLPTLYVVGGNALSAFTLDDVWLWAWELTINGNQTTNVFGVDVDMNTGAICVGGTGTNLASPVSGSDAWLSRFPFAGPPQWTRIYDVSGPIGGRDESIASVAARHGGLGCVGVGQASSGSAGTNILTVAYPASGSGAPNVNIADFNNRDNPGYDVEVGRGAGNPHNGHVLVSGRAWSVNVGMTLSYDAVLQWMAF